MADSLPPLTHTRILVVEDEGIVAKDIQARLRALGYDVPVTVSTGEAAIAAADELRPALVLMDIMLRGAMDGVQAAEQIRTRFDVPVIYLTAYSDDNTLRRAKVTEPFGYILKPFAEREVLTSIEMALYKHRTDSRLKESERWLSTTLRSIGDAVISTDAARNVRFMNAVAEQLTGWRADEAVGRPLDDVCRIVPGEGTPRGMTIAARDGGSVQIDQTVSSMRDAHGSELGVVLVFRDVTERRRTQEELRRQRDLYESLLHAQSDLGVGFVIVEDGRAVYVNAAYCAITGYSEGELFAMSSLFAILDPNERQNLEEQSFRRVGGSVEPNAYETRIIHKKGYPVELDVAVQVIDGGGRPQSIIIVRDITERKRAESTLLLTQLRLTTLLKNLPSVVLYETGGGREFISDNIEQLLGYPVARFLSDRDTFPKLMHPDDAASVHDVLQGWHGANEPGVLSYQFRARRADGTYVWIEDHMVEVKPRTGEKYMTGVMIDITERKRAEEELRRAKEKAEEYDRLKTNFISVISHEIRTPLNAILGCTKLVRNAVHDAADAALEEALQEYFAIVDRSGDRLMKLIESFLDIASIQAGNLKLKMITMPVEPVVRQAVDELRIKIRESNLELIERYEAGEASVSIDAERLAQIVTNILANAVKFTPRGSITVHTRIEEGNAVVTIQDTGIGIAPTFLPNMFTPFRQGSEGATRGYQGAGLGLSIGYRLTEAMGGTIEVASMEGEGTGITIRFPVVVDAPARPPRPVPDLGAAHRAERATMIAGHRALVVEDDYENMMYVRTVLRTTGWNVVTATNGEDALRLLNEQPPHIVLMDINLIGSLSGFDTLDVIRRDTRWAHIPVIAVTAHAFEEERQKIMGAGFDDYLAKPFTPDQLREVILKHLLDQTAVA